MNAAALSAPGEEPEPAGPGVTYENFCEHYCAHMSDVALAVTFAIEGPATLARRLIPWFPKEGS